MTQGPPPAASRIPTALRSGLAAYAERVSTLAGPQLESLAVFGTVLTPDWRPGQPVHQVMVLSGDDLALIRRLGVLGAEAGRLGLAAPLLVTPHLVRTSLDTFPLEWLEIGTCHQVLTGAELFADLAFAPEHVRLQCERESTVLAIALRQRLLRATGAGEPLSGPAEHVVRIVRGLLHLAGGDLPAAPSALLSAAAERLGLDLQPVVRALAGASGVDAITELHRTLATLIERSDRA
jgi:hypothetical protein